MDGFSGDVEAEAALFMLLIGTDGSKWMRTYQDSANADDDDIEKRQGDFSRGGEPQAFVHVQPEDPAQAVGEPTCEQCSLD